MSDSENFKVNPALDFECSEKLGIVLSFDFKILAINDAALKVHEWERESVLGKDYITLCKEQGVEVPVADVLNEVKQGKEVRSSERLTVIHWKEGGEYRNQTSFNYRFRPYYGLSNTIEGIHVVGGSQRTYAELAKAAPQDLKSKIIQAKSQSLGASTLEEFAGRVLPIFESTEGIFFIDSDGKVAFCNDLFAQYFEKSADGLKGEAFTDLGDDSEWHAIHEKLKKLIENGGHTSIRLDYSGTTFRLDLVGCSSSDKRKWVWGRMTPDHTSVTHVGITAAISNTIEAPQASIVIEAPSAEHSSSHAAGADSGGVNVKFETRPEILDRMSHIRKEMGLSRRVHPFSFEDADYQGLGDFLYNVPASIYCMDSMGYYLYANQKTLDIINMKSVAEIRGKTSLDIALHNDWPLDWAEDIYRHDMQVIKTGEVLFGVYYSIPKSGGKMGSGMEQFSAKYPLFDANNKVIGVQGISIELKMDEVKQYGIKV